MHTKYVGERPAGRHEGSTGCPEEPEVANDTALETLCTHGLGSSVGR